MTSNDTTYFLSNPHQLEHQDDPNKHHNTFYFLRLAQNKRNRTYSDDEIRNHLENQLPDTATSQCCPSILSPENGYGVGEEGVAMPGELVGV